MARPKNPRLGMTVSFAAQPLFSAMFKAADKGTRERSYPGRPYPTDRLPDCLLNKIQRCFKLPDRVGVLNVVNVLEHELSNARQAIQEEKRRALHKHKKAQLEALANAEIGVPMPSDLHLDVIGLLTGMGFWDKRYGRKLRPLSQVRDYVVSHTVVTEQLRQWARFCVMLGATGRSHMRVHGGGHSVAEQALVSVLVNFWQCIIGRKAQASAWETPGPKRTVGKGRRAREEHVRVIRAAAFVRFVHVCFRIVGARSPNGERLTLIKVRQRVVRALTDIKAAEKAGR